MDELTPEQQAKVDLMRLYLGDLPSSIFYPILTDEEYATILESTNWDVKKAVKIAGFSILFYLTQVNYRERTGDIEVWNNASIEYRKALNDFLDNFKETIPESIIPWVAGTSLNDICEYINAPGRVRSPLAQISHCGAWWTKVKDYECVRSGLGGCGCP